MLFAIWDVGFRNSSMLSLLCVQCQRNHKNSLQQHELNPFGIWDGCAPVPTGVHSTLIDTFLKPGRALGPYIWRC